MSEDIVKPVQAQLEAYNEKDLDRFLDQYHDDTKIFDIHGNLVMDGKEAMRASYAKLFEENPNVNAQVPVRMVLQSHVIDEEHVSGGVGIRAKLKVGVVYQVKDGLITKVTFVRD